MAKLKMQPKKRAIKFPRGNCDTILSGKNKIPWKNREKNRKVNIPPLFPAVALPDKEVHSGTREGDIRGTSIRRRITTLPQRAAALHIVCIPRLALL